MSLRIVQLGSPRHPDEGIRIGTVRRPPRGIKKEEYAARDYYDVWLPELAPSPELLSWVKSEPLTTGRWRVFEREYRREMREPSARRLIALLAAMARQTNISVGCYCEDEERCHRSVLRELLMENMK